MFCQRYFVVREVGIRILLKVTCVNALFESKGDKVRFTFIGIYIF